MRVVIKLEGKTHESMPDLNRNDVGQILGFDIIQFDGNVVDISTATILFKMKEINSSANKVSAGCTITDGAAGQCNYVTQAGDLDTEGVYDGELQVTIGSQITTVPLGRFRVKADLP